MEQLQIIDGAGGGYIAGVNIKNQLLARAINISAIHEASLLGNAYSWTSVTADIDAGDTALCVVNRSDTKLLVISRAYVWSDVASQIKIHVPAAATWAGTAVTGVNLNRARALEAPALAYADETGNAFVAANVIETVYNALAVNGQVTTALGVQIDFKDAVILGYNDAIAADVIAEIGAFEVTFIGYFIDA